MEGVSKAVSTLLDLVCATAVEDIYLETMSNHVTILMSVKIILIATKMPNAATPLGVIIVPARVASVVMDFLVKVHCKHAYY
jgi:Flp pilus assembly protein protease CpaA